MIDADTGFLDGEVTITSPFSPILYRQWDDSLTSPVGTFRTILTLDEVNFIRQWHLGDFKLYDGWFIRFNNDDKPFKAPLDWLYRQRSHSPLCNDIAKRMAASVWGKLGEHRDSGKLAPFLNYILSALVPAKARLQVAEFVLSNNLVDSLVSVAVDGVLVTRQVSLPQATGMGSWRLSSDEPALVISSGRQITSGKRPGGLTLEAILELIKQQPQGVYYSTTLKRPVTLVDVTEGGLELSELGKSREFHTSVDLMMEHDRQFNEVPLNGRELLEKKFTSQPLELAIERKLEVGQGA